MQSYKMGQFLRYLRSRKNGGGKPYAAAASKQISRGTSRDYIRFEINVLIAEAAFLDTFRGFHFSPYLRRIIKTPAKPIHIWFYGYQLD
jgi:hypothetical protein